MTKLKSYAKVNFYLKIGKKDPKDGYHPLESIFQTVSLADDVEITEINGASDTIEFDNSPPIPESTVHRALKVFRENFRVDEQAYRILIKKNIPSGAGLGGGSSNAAAVLAYLGKKYRIEKKSLIYAASLVGSDVPFFLEGGMAFVQGKGEKVTPLKNRLDNVEFVVWYPDTSISTPWAYSVFDEWTENCGRTGIPSASDLDCFFNETLVDIDNLKKIIYNDFLNPVAVHLKRYSELIEYQRSRINADLSFMSGSGSSFVFGFSNPDDAERCRRILTENYSSVFHCRPVYDLSGS